MNVVYNSQDEIASNIVKILKKCEFLLKNRAQLCIILKMGFCAYLYLFAWKRIGF